MIYEKGGRYERASALEKGRPDYYATSGAFADIPERALAIFYDTRTCSMLHDSKYGLHLMSDDYILNDLLRELGDRQ